MIIVRLAMIRLDSKFTTINPIILDVHYIKLIPLKFIIVSKIELCNYKCIIFKICKNSQKKNVLFTRE